MAQPRVTISILSYERKDTLRGALRSALDQRYQDLEVLVVDNGSTDGTSQMVREEFPSVKLVRLDENIGCAARNEGIEAASGDVVVTIDNDVLLLGTECIPEIVARLYESSSTACISFKILTGEGQLSRRDWCHPRDPERFADRPFDTYYVLEGACAFRKAAFLEVGGYWPELFLGHEGLDLALRLLSAGYDLRYAPTVAVHHLVSAEARPSSRIYYTFTRNAAWIAIRDLRVISALKMIATDWTMMGFASLRARELGAYLRGIKDAIFGAGQAVALRKPMSDVGRVKLELIRREAPGTFSKIKRHVLERPM